MEGGEMRNVMFAVMLALSATLIALGVGDVHRGAGLVAGGVLLAGWSWLILGELGPAEPVETTDGEAETLAVDG
jgi:hypothetical protein